MSPSQRESDTDQYVTMALWALGGVCLAGLANWIAAVLAVGVSGGGWESATLAPAGTFFAELVLGGTPTQAWHAATGSTVFAPEWLFWMILCSMAVGVGGAAYLVWRHRGRSRKQRNDARWASQHDEKTMVVPDDPSARPHRIVVGRSKANRRCLAAEDCVSAVVFGPNGSGKTVGLIIPNVLEWQGSVVMTTAKPQDLAPVMAARSRLGPVWVIAPGGAPGV